MSEQDGEYQRGYKDGFESAREQFTSEAKFAASAPPKPAPDAVRRLLATVRPFVRYMTHGSLQERNRLAREIDAALVAPVPPADGAGIRKAALKIVDHEIASMIEMDAHPVVTKTLENVRKAIAAISPPPCTGAAEPVADRTLWAWEKIAEAAFERARRTDAVAAYKLRSAFRAIIEAGLAAAAPTVRGDREKIADDIRALGWAVAIHNDYRQFGIPCTFWLFTKGDRAVKGEGASDAEALNKVRAIITPPALTAAQCDEISRRST